MAYRYFIELQFNGKAFFGWQIQPNMRTVQGELNEKLAILLKYPIETVGAGRTDTGVHARYFVAHFDCSVSLKGRTEALCRKLNQFLPPDIFVERIIHVPANAHARYDATARTYQYYISTRKDVFMDDFCWRTGYRLDLELMNQGAEVLLAHTDFTSFSKLHSNTKTNICHIKSASWSKSDHQLVFTITADRFLRNMVRAIVGTLVLLGRKKITVSDLEEILASRNRSKAGESVPAKGLFLQKIEYPYTF